MPKEIEEDVYPGDIAFDEEYEDDSGDVTEVSGIQDPDGEVVEDVEEDMAGGKRRSGSRRRAGSRRAGSRRRSSRASGGARYAGTRRKSRKSKGKARKGGKSRKSRKHKRRHV
jgi:hypothetical protein